LPQLATSTRLATARMAIATVISFLICTSLV
jgi:hypothetical protein